MAGKAVSYRFMDVLAKSVGIGSNTLKPVLAEISRLQSEINRLQAEIDKLQARPQALEHPAQDKAPTNHAI